MRTMLTAALACAAIAGSSFAATEAQAQMGGIGSNVTGFGQGRSR